MKTHKLECPECGGAVEVHEQDVEVSGLALQIDKRDCDCVLGVRYDENMLPVLMDEFEVKLDGLTAFGELVEELNKRHLHVGGEALLTMICEAEHNSWDGCERPQLIEYNRFCEDLLTWLRVSDDVPESWQKRKESADYGWTCGGNDNGYDAAGLRYSGPWMQRKIDPPLTTAEEMALRRALGPIAVNTTVEDCFRHAMESFDTPTMLRTECLADLFAVLRKYGAD